MKAMQAAAMTLFNRDDLEEWPGGVLFQMATRKLEDDRRYLLAVGRNRVMLFIDHPEPDGFYAWELARESDIPEDALDFLVQTAHVTSLADFLAMGFEYL